MHKNFRNRIGLALLGLWLALFCACNQSFEITEEILAAAVADVFPLVEKETGVGLAGTVSVRLAGADEIGEIIREELFQQFVSILNDEKRAEQEADTLATLYSTIIYAKYAFEEKSILVCPENLEELSEILGEPLLNTPEGLRAILAHECVHAADDLRYDLHGQACAVENLEASQAFNAVVEGHAQFVSRAVCDRAGWTDAFEAFTRSIGTFPEDLFDEKEQGLLLLCRIMVQNVASAYYDGEEFIEALDEQAGADAVKRAFVEPPSDSETIQHPEWFVDPSKRRTARYDLESALDIVQNRFDAEAWQNTRSNLTRPQIEASLSLLPAEEVDAAMAGLDISRFVMLNPKDAPQSKLVLAALYEFRSEEAAATFTKTLGRLHRVKDEKMSEGQVRIVDQHYAPLGLADGEGTFAKKEVSAMGNTMTVVSVIARRKDVCLEIAYSVEPISHDDAWGLAGEIL